MFIVDEKKILRLMRSIYKHRLNEVMNEVDVFDDRGNMILGKDLKVYHKDSGLEYTIADVRVDPMGDDTEIVLRLPDEPRIDPPESVEILADIGSLQHLGEQDAPPSCPKKAIKKLGEEDDADIQSSPGDLSLPRKQAVPEPATGEPDDDEVLFVIDKEQFEKEYEVK